jgi:hypothetical protein
MASVTVDSVPLHPQKRKKKHFFIQYGYEENIIKASTFGICPDRSGEVECESVDWIHLAERLFLNKVLSLRVP